MDASPFTFVIIAITVLIHYRAKQDYSIIEKLKFHPYSIKQNGSEWTRFITNGFVHANDIHLFVNMFVLYMFGSYIEGAFVKSVFGPVNGRILYIVLYLTSIVAASIPSYLKHQNNPSYAAVGASGATSAIVLAFVLFRPWARLDLFFIIPIPAIIAGVAYLIYSSYASKNNNDNIAHDAHLWGAIYGFMFTLLFVLLLAPGELMLIKERLLDWRHFLNYF